MSPVGLTSYSLQGPSHTLDHLIFNTSVINYNNNHHQHLCSTDYVPEIIWIISPSWQCFMSAVKLTYSLVSRGRYYHYAQCRDEESEARVK